MFYDTLLCQRAATATVRLALEQTARDATRAACSRG